MVDTDLGTMVINENSDEEDEDDGTMKSKSQKRCQFLGRGMNIFLF